MNNNPYHLPSFLTNFTNAFVLSFAMNFTYSLRIEVNAIATPNKNENPETIYEIIVATNTLFLTVYNLDFVMFVISY